ncbi:MAG: hypothetical protein P8X86_01755 [Desulfofustis sp.]
MQLQRSAQLAFVGVTYVYAIKLSDALLTSIMYTPLSIAIVVGLNILAGVAQLVFFLLLRKDVKPAANTVHLIASWCGICGSVAFFGLLGYSIMITVYSFVIWNYWSGAAMQAVLAEMGISRTAMLVSATASYLLIAAFFIRFGWLRGHSVQR